MSILKQIADIIKADKTKVCFPSQSEGECLQEYVVVKYGGAVDAGNVSSERPIYTIMCYVPQNKYSRLEDFVFETKKKMKKLFPLLSYIGNETPSFYDDKLKAHMISFQYQGIRKKENW